MSPHRASMAKRIRWQSVAALVGLILICAVLVYQGVVFSRADQWMIGGALVVMASVALLFGRDAPEEPPQRGGP